MSKSTDRTNCRFLSAQNIRWTSTASRTRRGILTQLLCTTALIIFPRVAGANPQDGQVAAGSAAIVQTSPARVDINQTSQKAIVNWQSFSIAPNETTNFNQPNASAITLNRVTGIDPSQIAGHLTANGQVWLVNPNGIVFGPSARVDVAGLLATTLDISDRNFLAGNYKFDSLKNPGAMVVNAGQITVKDAGLAALVAPGVENSGIIQANLGQIQLSSAAGFTIDFYGDGTFNFLLDNQVTQAITKPDGSAPSAAVTNTGKLIANGGRVLVTANVAKSVVDNAINMDGYAQATSVKQANGEIILDGGSEGAVQVAGSLDVSGKGDKQSGGTVQVTGHDIELSAASKINASGNAGGGTVLVGGDYQGGGSLAHAKTTVVTAGATIDASAIVSGNGGKVVIWSDGQTNFQGSISAVGGASGGNGGTAEVSSHGVLDFSGIVDLRAPSGQLGSLLLDPENVTISATGDTPTLPVTGPTTLNATSDNSVLAVSTLQSALALGDVTVSTGSSGNQAGDITVASNVTWANGSNLTLSAYRNIAINNGVTISNTGAGSLALRSDNTGTGIGTVSFAGTGKADFSQSTGTVTIFYNPASNPSGSIVNGTSYATSTNFAPFVTANSGVTGQLTSYMLVNTVYDLQNIQNNLSGNYALGRDIDASATSTWNAVQGPGGVFSPPAGFSPIGGGTSFFTGKLNGLDHVISGLFVSSTSTFSSSGALNLFVGTGNYGLFGVIGPSGNVQNLSFTNADISASIASGGLGDVGVLAGFNVGSITNVSAEGIVHPGGAQNAGVTGGGLVGSNIGTIKNSSADVAVSVVASAGSNGSTTSFVFGGGLVGASGACSSCGPANYIGNYTGSISQSYAIGSVTVAGANGQVAGGLVGSDSGAGISNSYARGNVTATGTSPDAGGLVGITGGPSTSAAINETYATGFVSATSSLYVGGLIGTNASGTLVLSSSYWNTQTTGQSASIGGLGLTTAQLTGGLPSSFDPTIWASVSSINGGYPSLKSQVPSSGVSSVTGITFSITPTPVPTPKPFPTPTPTPTGTPTPSPTTTPTPSPTATPTPSPTATPTPSPITTATPTATPVPTPTPTSSKTSTQSTSSQATALVQTNQSTTQVLAQYTPIATSSTMAVTTPATPTQNTSIWNQLQSLPDAPTLTPANNLIVIGGALAIGGIAGATIAETATGIYGDAADAYNQINDIAHGRSPTVIAHDVEATSWDVLNTILLAKMIPGVSEGVSSGEQVLTASAENLLTNYFYNTFYKK